ncbi:MAG: hypothetical protein ACJAYJ_005180 [Saprospiraceae bacterium]|jgi:hypothetical protein
MSFLFTNDITIDGCQFIDNEAVESIGGAMAMAEVPSASISNYEFIGNSSDSLAGAFLFDDFGAGGELELIVTNCNFAGNSSNRRGAFYYLTKGSGNNNLRFSDCTFTDNATVTTPLLDFADGGALFFEYFAGNPINDTIILDNCLLENNTAEGQAVGIMLANLVGANNHLEINNCEIFNNTANGDVGEMLVTEEGNTTTSVKVSNTHFKGNSALKAPGFALTYNVDSLAPTSRDVKLVNYLLSIIRMMLKQQF